MLAKRLPRALGVCASRMMSISSIDRGRPKGSVAAPFTPFKEDGEINFNSIPEYAAHLKTYGVQSLFAQGTTGEGLSLTLTERKNLAESWEDTKQFDQIIHHIGAGNLRDSQELARHAESINADAIACISPSYFKPQSVDALVEYMSQVAAAAPNTPFYLYDFNLMTGIYLNVEDFFVKAENNIPNLVGVKHSSPELNSVLLCHKVLGGKYHMLLGGEDSLLPGLSIGVENTITTSFMVPLQNKIRNAFRDGDMGTARKYHLASVRVCAVRSKYATGAGSFAVSRAIMSMLDLDLGPPRLPLQEIPKSSYDALKSDLESIGFFSLVP